MMFKNCLPLSNICQLALKTIVNEKILPALVNLTLHDRIDIVHKV
jgi:hypothetical protein